MVWHNRLSVVETFRQQIGPETSQSFKNSKFQPRCFLYLLGIKRTVRNWRGVKDKFTAHESLGKKGERKRVSQKTVIPLGIEFNWRIVFWYISVLATEWKTPNHLVKQLHVSQDRTISSLGLYATPKRCDLSVIHKVTFPLLSKSNTEFGVSSLHDLKGVKAFPCFHIWWPIALPHVDRACRSVLQSNTYSWTPQERCHNSCVLK